MAPSIGDFFTAVPGVVHSTTIPAAVGEILVRNDSPYDLWVKFDSAPSAAPGPLTFSQYDLEVTPGREQINPPPGFTGRMFIGCYNPGGKAASGTISSRANVYVRYYPQGQSAGPGAAYSALTGLDTTSQQRVISIPTEPHIAVRMAGNPISNTLILQGPLSPQGPGQATTTYLYSIFAFVLGQRYGVVVWYTVDVDGSNNVLAEHELFRTPFLGGEPINPVIIAPISESHTTPANTAKIYLGCDITAPAWPGGSTGNTISGTIECDVDLSGQNPPPAIGNGAGTPPGAIY